MIRRVTIRNFKRFGDQSFDLGDSVVLAGPNNAGKSTLLQAVATWKLGLDRWVSQRGQGSRAVKRTGVPVTRTEFTTVPLREMNLLWKGRRLSRAGGRPGAPRLIEIIVEGESDGRSWTCGLELQYANREVAYVRPQGVKNLELGAVRNFPPLQARDLAVVHVPPLSGVQREEPRLDRGMQDLLVGQGRPGEILRNLLWEIFRRDDENWKALTGHVRHLFRIEVLAPSYSSAQPYIVCEYRDPDYPQRPFDLSNVGSGTLQVLLLLAFLYARRAAVILLDEPDAHQHVILQKQVYGLVRRVARERGGQVIAATHSEVLLDATEPGRVIGFFADAPRLLVSRSEHAQVREALKRLTTTDLLLGRETGAVLYVESGSDERILIEWARILGHPARKFFERPFVHRLGGRKLKEAKDHLFALRAAFPDMRALCLLDGDNREEPDQETASAGLVVLRWRRYEIENYLLHPGAVARFARLPLMDTSVQDWFRRQVPPGTDWFGDHVALVRIKASDEFLVPLLEEIGAPTPKRDLFLLAAAMRDTEIHPEVVEKLDHIGETLNPLGATPPRMRE